MKKIKVAYIIDSAKRAGAQKLLLDICRNIDKKKFDVTVIFGKRGGFYKEFKKIKCLNITELKNKPKKIDSPALTKIPIFIKQQKELRKIVAKEGFDIIHSHLFFPDIHNSLLKRRFKGIKAVSTKHDTGLPRKKRYWAIGALFDSNMDYITTCSDSVKKILSNYRFIKNVKTIHNAIDFASIESAQKKNHSFIKKGSFNIISVGRLTEQKGFDHLIKTFKLFNNKVKNSNLFICGIGEKQAELESLIKELKLENNVYLLRERNDVYSLMKSCDLFMLLSNWEGFGIVFLEAMACRLPVIGSNVDGIREIIEDRKNGFLVNRLKYSKTADLVVKLSKNRRLMEKTSKQGTKSAKERFDIRKVVKEYEKIYSSLKKSS